MEDSFEVRDYREKNWHWQDNEYLNGYAKLCGVSATAVYLSLCRHADKKQNCFPSIKLIAEEHNISVRTVVTAIQKLEKYNIIKKEKTRKKDGKWLNNLYILLNKSQWDSQVQPLHTDSQVQITTQPSANNDISQVQPLHTNKTNITKHIKNKTHTCNASVAGKDINSLIEKFEPINPSYERLYPNKTQRSALERMVKKWSVAIVGEMIDQLPEIVKQPFAPRVTTPLQMEGKLGEIKLFVEQKQNKSTFKLIKL